MIRNGSRVVRHCETKESAITILEGIVQKRLPMLLHLQLQMNVEGKGLEETDAGIKLNEELFEIERKHKEESPNVRRRQAGCVARKDKEDALQIDCRKPARLPTKGRQASKSKESSSKST